jgi:hypothetical protein
MAAYSIITPVRTTEVTVKWLGINVVAGFCVQAVNW